LAYTESRKAKGDMYMENNKLNNHIYQNTARYNERGANSRADREAVERILNRENGESCAKTKQSMCDSCEVKCKNEHGGEVFVTNVGRMAYRNENFRESIWTGNCLQMTLMSIPVGKDIGVEIHGDTDQYIRVEHGNAVAFFGEHEDCLDKKYKLCAGDAIFVPAGTWHNIINVGRCSLKLSSVYAPPHHPRCTVEKRKN
jgi:mannose-6-phosphate isomerase-like protein (cupin superfamily)